jgi:hypothetical protein
MSAKELGAKQATLANEALSNEAVRAMLRAHGDDGAATRHVLHYAYPKHDAPFVRAELVAQLHTRGFQVSDAEAENGLVMEHYRPVAGEDFDVFTAELRDWFADNGWDYDGWECAVVLPDLAAAS